LANLTDKECRIPQPVWQRRSDWNPNCRLIGRVVNRRGCGHYRDASATSDTAAWQPCRPRSTSSCHRRRNWRICR